jgi:hypothetical protein
MHAIHKNKTGGKGMQNKISDQADFCLYLAVQVQHKKANKQRKDNLISSSRLKIFDDKKDK